MVDYKKLDMGEMINVWIEHHGSLDLDTDKQTIIDFYKNVKKEKNMIDIEKNMIDIEKTIVKIEEAASIKVEGFDNRELIRAILKTFEAEVIVHESEKRLAKMIEGNA